MGNRGGRIVGKRGGAEGQSANQESVAHTKGKRWSGLCDCAIMCGGGRWTEKKNCESGQDFFRDAEWHVMSTDHGKSFLIDCVMRKTATFRFIF